MNLKNFWFPTKENWTWFFLCVYSHETLHPNILNYLIRNVPALNDLHRLYLVTQCWLMCSFAEVIISACYMAHCDGCNSCHPHVCGIEGSCRWDRWNLPIETPQQTKWDWKEILWKILHLIFSSKKRTACLHVTVPLVPRGWVAHTTPHHCFLSVQ